MERKKELLTEGERCVCGAAGSLFGGLIMWAGIAYLVFSLVGCAGMELYSAVGVKRVDEYESRQATRREDTRPLKCLFVTCDSPKGEVRGAAYDK